MPLDKEIAAILMKGPVLKLHVQLIKLGYEIPKGELKGQYYGKGTKTALRDFQSAHGLPVTGTVDDATRIRIQQVLEEKGAGQEEPGTVPEQFVVHGQVLEPAGKPFANGLVQAFHKGLRTKDIRLGEATTDEDGFYSIFYSTKSLHNRKNANLFVRVFDSSRKVIATSDGGIIFNAPSDVQCNLNIDPDKYRGKSEYSRLMEKVTPLLGDETLESLTESEIMQLAGESGVDTQQLRLAVQAARLAAKIDSLSELLYGLFQQGLPTNLPALLAQTPDTLRNALQHSMDENIIPSGMETEIEQALEKLGSLAVQAPEGLLTNPAFLFKPGLLYRNIVDLDDLNDDEDEFLTAKLNEYLQGQILSMLGSPSESLARAVESLVYCVDYRQCQDSSLTIVLVNQIFPEIKKNPALVDEATRMENHLSRVSSAKVRDLLHLDAPVNKNSILETDIRTARVYAIASELELNAEAARNLIERGLDLGNVNNALLETLVEDGVITPEQKPKMKTTIELCRLTGDNMPFVSSLRASGVHSLFELTGWTKEDWSARIKNGQIPLPSGETAETYARNIQHNIQQTLPTQVMFNRLLEENSAKRVDCLDSMHDLLEDNDRLISGRKPASINWQKVGKTKRKQLQTDLQDLTILSNNFIHLGVEELINDKTASLDQKKSLINSRLELFETFYKNNQELDLRNVDFFAKQDNIDWSDISEEEKPLIRKQLMAYQRVLACTETAEETQALLNSGYDSAMAVATQTEAEFMAGCGLDKGIARKIYERRNGDFTKVGQLHEAVRDSVQGQFKDLTVANPDPNLVNDLREIDGFEDLFNSQNYCACEECKSILGPAAYFVDLMHFIEEFSWEYFKDAPGHPIRLKTRRSDLWTLKLTCENTHTLIPYLTLVDEVLENYLRKVMGSDVDIYKELASKAIRSSFSVPFNLPLEELQLYLSHFGLSLCQLYRTVKVPTDPDDRKLREAKLAISKDEFDVISQPDPDYIITRFGGIPGVNGDELTGFYVQDFLRLSGITREQLDELLNLNFNPDLKNVTVAKELDEESQTYTEILENITNIRADFMHRFIRLWRKTTWTISELDLVLTSLYQFGVITSNKGNILNVTTVDYVARWMDIQEKLNLNVEELCSLIYLIPESLFRRLFDVTKLFGVDDINRTVDISVTPITPILLGGLSLTETEFLLLVSALEKELDFEGIVLDLTNLDLTKISMIYRYARMARALKLSIDDFVKALPLVFEPDKSIIEQIEHFVDFSDWLRSSPFNISELRFILIGEESTSVKYKSIFNTAVELAWEVQSSAEPDKVAKLKTRLTKLFNVTDARQNDLFNWVNTDINSEEILTALTTEFKVVDSKSNKIPPEPNNPDEVEPLFNLLKEIERVMYLHSNLRFKDENIKYLSRIDNWEKLLNSNIKQLTIDDLKTLTYYQKLVAQNEDGVSSVHLVLDDFDKNSHILADLWKVDETLIASLTSELNPPAELNPIEALIYLWNCLELCQTLGVNGYSLQLLMGEDTNEYESLCKARDIALGAFNSKYEDEKTRKEKLEPFLDRINVRKRDVLCAYIIARQEQLKFKDMQDIYAYFLLDVEMSGCFRISRLVAGLSSLQLYVHRCLVNLEQSEPTKPTEPAGAETVMKVTLTPDLAKEWEWRKNYRVWEANRKIFLYSENYLEPDLRADKTHLFRELEDELLQQKITKETAEAAYCKYVAQLMELAKLRIVGSYYDENTKLYYFFGRTHTQPYQYYFRTFEYENGLIWGNWIKMELAIEADEISALIHLGRLYVFWTDVQRKDITNIIKGDLQPSCYVFKVYVKYAFLTENDKWSAPQKNYVGHLCLDEDFISDRVGEVIEDKNRDNVLDRFQIQVFRKPYPVHDETNNSLIQLFYFGFWSQYKLIILASCHVLSLSSNAIVSSTAEDLSQAEYINSEKFYFLLREAELSLLNPDIIEGYVQNGTTQFTNVARRIHQYSSQEKLGYFSYGCQLQVPYDFGFILVSPVCMDKLSETLFSKGIGGFLTLNIQYEPNEYEHVLDFNGSFGNYLEELFFHIPFLIASHLNADQKFEEAKWWYERIFDPSVCESPEPMPPTDRVWRYKPFRNLSIETMKDILDEDKAIDQYKKDPFNPHAIAKLRLNAYQKTIVMKYIDNLIDWGDALFAQDTIESINEATMLYVLAADILGKRPAKLGPCETAEDGYLTFENIDPWIDSDGNSEFIIILENWCLISRKQRKIDSHLKKIALPDTNTRYTIVSNQALLNSPTTDSVWNVPEYFVQGYEDVVAEVENYQEGIQIWEGADEVVQSPAVDVIVQSLLAFCVPPNYDLLRYWDRVEDRLFKIRHCMNISGIRRVLALFQPPIEPMLLVRAKAAGLSLEEILEGKAELPHYRFSYLIEKAKGFAQTVQSFGSALLSALDKKDVEELTLLRSVHERYILRMTEDVKKKQFLEAKYQYQAMVEAEINVQNRVDHYKNLIAGDLLLNDGLIDWERTQHLWRKTATDIKVHEGVYRTLAAIFYLIPNFGSPFAFTYGGKEEGASYQAWAEWFASMSSVAEAISTSAGLEATFQRRVQEWEHQLQISKQELKQIDMQRLASEIRQLVAEKELKIHETSMEQADDVYDFYKNKFTSLGLYDFLATNLTRLYRTAYWVAYEMALTAERAYQFERDDETTFFVMPDNWQYDRAGLLAGEQLLLQLEQMEKAYIEQNTRDFEINQSFSMALLQPEALLQLKETGTCQFEIPEIAFDMFYPGQYNRRIKSVRITIPCVVGPYTNVSATLSLTWQAVRKDISTYDKPLEMQPGQGAVATSSAQNDGGVFELNFRDERYLPFEGSGAISEWQLDLPNVLRSFDYGTISDVIFHISYTAKYDPGFRGTVEHQMGKLLQKYAEDIGLWRLLSLKHEFPDVFYHLLSSSEEKRVAEFELTQKHFPYFLIDKNLDMASPITVFLKLKGKEPIKNINISINNIAVGSLIPYQGTNLTSGEVQLSGNPIMKWEVTLGGSELNQDVIEDILILIRYTTLIPE